MHLHPLLGLLALAIAASVQLVTASTQAVIHIEVDEVGSMDYQVSENRPMHHFTEDQPTQMNKTQADEVCANDPAYGPKYQACMGGPNGAPSGCVYKPFFYVQPCFGNQYTSPKDNSRGCCPVNQTFSYNKESLEGACCSEGNAYSYDPDTKCGKCKPVQDKCSKPFEGSVAVGGKNFFKYEGKGTWGSDLGAEYVKSWEACEELCATNPKCVAIDFRKSNSRCWPKYDSNDKMPGVKDGDVDSAIIPICLKDTDTCQDIDNKIRVYDGVAYTFMCKHEIGTGNVIPTYKTPDMLTCIRDCSKLPNCQGVNWRLDGTTCNLKSIYETDPKASDPYLAVVPLQKRGGS